MSLILITIINPYFSISYVFEHMNFGFRVTVILDFRAMHSSAEQTSIVCSTLPEASAIKLRIDYIRYYRLNQGNLPGNA